MLTIKCELTLILYLSSSWKHEKVGSILNQIIPWLNKIRIGSNIDPTWLSFVQFDR